VADGTSGGGRVLSEGAREEGQEICKSILHGVVPWSSQCQHSEQRILQWHPHRVGITESWRLFQVDKSAPKVVKDAQRRYMMRYAGPAGLT